MHNAGTIVDVRTPREFIRGNVEGSINIPLQEMDRRLEELKSLDQPIVVCCASGARSALAADYLKASGIACKDAGSWLNLNTHKHDSMV